MDYLTGLLGEEEKVAKICAVVIAGNSLFRLPERKAAVAKLKEFDSLLAQLCASVQVGLSSTPSQTFILPGESDPSTTTLPQESLHPTLLPR